MSYDEALLIVCEFNRIRMRNNPEQLFAFLQSMGGAIWKADANMQHLSFLSDHKVGILGFLPEKWKENPDF